MWEVQNASFKVLVWSPPVTEINVPCSQGKYYYTNETDNNYSNIIEWGSTHWYGVDIPHLLIWHISSSFMLNFKLIISAENGFHFNMSKGYQLINVISIASLLGNYMFWHFHPYVLIFNYFLRFFGFCPINNFILNKLLSNHAVLFQCIQNSEKIVYTFVT